MHIMIAKYSTVQSSIFEYAKLFKEQSVSARLNRLVRGNFFQCHVFAMKSVQNLKSFWRSSQNYFVLALFSSLYS
jgi:hypothetical protein